MVPKGHRGKKHSVGKTRQEHQDDTEDNWLLDNNYQPEDIHTIAKEQYHLNNKQRSHLKKILQKHKSLFSGQVRH